MKKSIFVAIALSMAITNGFAQKGEEIHKTFNIKRMVKINTVSGDCEVTKGSTDKIVVDLFYTVEPEGAFEPEFIEKENSLRLKERWYGSSSGRVTWKLTVPSDTEIDFSTASGDLSLEGMHTTIEVSTASGDVTVIDSEGEFECSTASGDITIEDTKGEFDLSTASGDVEADHIEGYIDISTASGDIDISDSKGTFELSCASGSVDASYILIEDESTFSTASGKVSVKVAKSPEFNLDLSSASGSVVLDYNGNPLKGYFEFTAQKYRGRIASSRKFDHEEEFERHNQLYVRKSFTAGKKTPHIRIKTASGRATLRE